MINSYDAFLNAIIDSLKQGEKVHISTIDEMEGHTENWPNYDCIISNGRTNYYVKETLNPGFMNVICDLRMRSEIKLKTFKGHIDHFNFGDNSNMTGAVDLEPEVEQFNDCLSVKAPYEVDAVVKPKKETFEATIVRIGKSNFLEICSYMKYGGFPVTKLPSKYNVTPWFIGNVRAALGFARDERNDQIIKDSNNGMHKDELMEKYNLKGTRLGQILHFYRVMSTISKELFD